METKNNHVVNCQSCDNKKTVIVSCQETHAVELNFSIIKHQNCSAILPYRIDCLNFQKDGKPGNNIK